jgi:anti-anti-sigma factor
MPEQPNYRVEISLGEGRTTVAAYGELDLATAAGFEATLREQLAAGPVLLDLAELSFMDSSGVHVLDRVLRDLDPEGWKLLVRPTLQDRVRQILDLTGIYGLLPFDREPPA